LISRRGKLRPGDQMPMLKINEWGNPGREKKKHGGGRGCPRGREECFGLKKIAMLSKKLKRAPDDIEEGSGGKHRPWKGRGKPGVRGKKQFFGKGKGGRTPSRKKGWKQNVVAGDHSKKKAQEGLKAATPEGESGFNEMGIAKQVPLAAACTDG